ncbi:Placenta-specific protein 9 [Pteropus alecto]|uniref:Placenta-specific protein 9 n=1 Tax=Pteropus alecto TaxID=9402 RepID=L5KDT6_PTEAL|nr:Placenta-specific protein 9 [Pteropus alecto]
MQPLLCALAGLALLRASGADAGEWGPGGRGPERARPRWTVEKTVEHLEAEVKGLLGQLEELAWNLPPGPFSPTPDLLGDGEWSRSLLNTRAQVARQLEEIHLRTELGILTFLL